MFECFYFPTRATYFDLRCGNKGSTGELHAPELIERYQDVHS